MSVMELKQWWMGVLLLIGVVVALFALWPGLTEAIQDIFGEANILREPDITKLEAHVNDQGKLVVEWFIDGNLASIDFASLEIRTGNSIFGSMDGIPFNHLDAISDEVYATIQASANNDNPGEGMMIIDLNDVYVAPDVPLQLKLTIDGSNTDEEIANFGRFTAKSIMEADEEILETGFSPLQCKKEKMQLIVGQKEIGGDDAPEEYAECIEYGTIAFDMYLNQGITGYADKLDEMDGPNTFGVFRFTVKTDGGLFWEAVRDGAFRFDNQEKQKIAYFRYNKLHDHWEWRDASIDVFGIGATFALINSLEWTPVAKDDIGDLEFWDDIHDMREFLKDENPRYFEASSSDRVFIPSQDVSTINCDYPKNLPVKDMSWVNEDERVAFESCQKNPLFESYNRLAEVFFAQQVCIDTKGTDMEIQLWQDLDEHDIGVEDLYRDVNIDRRGIKISGQSEFIKKYTKSKNANPLNLELFDTLIPGDAQTIVRNQVVDYGAYVDLVVRDYMECDQQAIDHLAKQGYVSNPVDLSNEIRLHYRKQITTFADDANRLHSDILDCHKGGCT